MLELIAANVILAIGACIQGVVGWGLALIGAPLLFLINPGYLPGPIIMSALVLSLMLIYRERNGLRLTDLSWAILGSATGIITAGIVLIFVSGEQFQLIFGLLIVSAVLISILGYHPKITRKSSIAAGFASGFMGTCSSVGGPPIALLYQSQSAEQVRANLPAFFLFGATLAIIVLSLTGTLGKPEVSLFIKTLPGVIIGFFLSGYMKNWLINKPLRPAILAIAGLAGLLAIIEGVVS